jgi:hypothetical protein
MSQVGSSGSSQVELPYGPLSFDRIDAEFEGQLVLVRVTRVDDLETPIEGEVLEIGKRRINKFLAQMGASNEVPQSPHCFFRAGNVGTPEMPSKSARPS